MNTLPTTTKSQNTCSIYLSLQDDEIVIENQTAAILSDPVLSKIADSVLGWFCDGVLRQEFIIQDFKDCMLMSLPNEGGIIPVENVIDWLDLIELNDRKVLTVLSGAIKRYSLYG
jgi:hypothetical protein